MTLDAFGRAVTLADPVNSASSTTAYRADGQVATVIHPTTPSATTTVSSYDAAGRPTGNATGSAASHAYTLNRAGNRMTEAPTVNGDPANGSAAFAYDPLGRLTSFTPGQSGSSPVTYGWNAVPDRTSISSPSATAVTFDAANRPTISSADPDSLRPDGLDRRDSDLYVLGRLASVTVAGTGVAESFTYDPLDRLASVTRTGVVERFRYVGLSERRARRPLLATRMQDAATEARGARRRRNRRLG